MRNLRPQRPPAAFSLVLVLVTIGICFVILTGVMLWSSNSGQISSRMTERYATSAAAEAAAAKVVAHISEDFRRGGRALVDNNLAAYADKVPTGTEHAVWNNYDFLDEAGTPGRAYVNLATNWHWGPVNWKGTNLVGQSATYRVVATARSRTVPMPTAAAVRQDLEMTSIPLASFFLFAQPDQELHPSSGSWEINGPVHGNANIYCSPNVAVTFADQVTAAGKILPQRAPGDPSGSGGGTVTYQSVRESEAGLLRLSLAGLPTNPSSLWAFCSNHADLRITIFSSTNLWAVNHAGIGGDDLTNLVWQFLDPGTSNSEGTIADWRECDVNGVAGPPERILATRFSVTNFQSLGVKLKHYMVGGRPPESVYLEDLRFPGMMGSFSVPFYAVKVMGGQTLSAPLTIATRQPLYVQGPFNAPSPGSTNGALAAGFIADAVTILSEAWVDGNSPQDLVSGVRDAASSGTTINAAIITGNVPTQEGVYSGGLESLVRLLESWFWGGSQRPLYINGSLVLLFHSRLATGEWGQSNVYIAPYRIFRFAPHVGATAPIVSDLAAAMLVRSAWRTTSPGSTE